MDADTNYYALPADATSVSPGNTDAALGVTQVL